MIEDEQYMNKREQNYMFAYNVVPAFLFRSDFAKIIAFSHPQGFGYLQKYWERLANIFPEEQVVSDAPLKTEAYHLADGVYCLVVTMPPTERYLEVQFLGIVFQPKVRYFVAGRSDLAGMDYKNWTVREVTPSGHGPRGRICEADPVEFLNAIARAMDLQPNIRIASGEEMRKNAEHIETFPAEFQMTTPEEVFAIAATYKVISLKVGDTSGIPPATAQQIYEQGGEPMQRVVMAIIEGAQQKAFADQSAADPTNPNKKRWWQFWK